MLGNFAFFFFFFFLFVCLFVFFIVCGFFLNYFFSNKSFRNTIRVSNSLDPDQARRFVEPGSKLFAKVISRRQN